MVGDIIDIDDNDDDDDEDEDDDDGLSSPRKRKDSGLFGKDYDDMGERQQRRMKKALKRELSVAWSNVAKDNTDEEKMNGTLLKVINPRSSLQTMDIKINQLLEAMKTMYVIAATNKNDVAMKILGALMVKAKFQKKDVDTFLGDQIQVSQSLFTQFRALASSGLALSAVTGGTKKNTDGVKICLILKELVLFCCSTNIKSASAHEVRRTDGDKVVIPSFYRNMTKNDLLKAFMDSRRRRHALAGNEEDGESVVSTTTMSQLGF
jgi:hypothetical protein